MALIEFKTLRSFMQIPYGGGECIKELGTIWMCMCRTKIPVVFRAIENYRPFGGLQLNLEKKAE